MFLRSIVSNVRCCSNISKGVDCLQLASFGVSEGEQSSSRVLRLLKKDWKASIDSSAISSLSVSLARSQVSFATRQYDSPWFSEFWLAASAKSVHYSRPTIVAYLNAWLAGWPHSIHPGEDSLSHGRASERSNERTKIWRKWVEPAWNSICQFQSCSFAAEWLLERNMLMYPFLSSSRVALYSIQFNSIHTSGEILEIWATPDTLKPLMSIVCCIVFDFSGSQRLPLSINSS